jgi:hypothetical protein
MEDGFIRLKPRSRTHDITLADFHGSCLSPLFLHNLGIKLSSHSPIVPTIQRVAADINDEVQAVWPKRHEFRYAKVHVLLLSWEDDDLGVDSEIKDLRSVFERSYRYEVEHHRIPSDKPDKNVKRKVLEFLEDDSKDT